MQILWTWWLVLFIVKFDLFFFLRCHVPVTLETSMVRIFLYWSPVKSVHCRHILNQESLFRPIYFFTFVLSLSRINSYLDLLWYCSLPLLIVINKVRWRTVLRWISLFLVLLIRSILSIQWYNHISNTSILFMISAFKIHISYPHKSTDHTLHFVYFHGFSNSMIIR